MREGTGTVSVNAQLCRFQLRPLFSSLFYHHFLELSTISTIFLIRILLFFYAGLFFNLLETQQNDDHCEQQDTMMCLTSGNLENFILFTVICKKVSLLSMFATISPVYLIFLLEMKEEKTRPLGLLCFIHMKNKGVRKRPSNLFTECSSSCPLHN